MHYLEPLERRLLQPLSVVRVRQSDEIVRPLAVVAPEQVSDASKSINNLCKSVSDFDIDK